ncbi:DUF1292 domain-containing protein [Clostridium botulinum]|uniref:DUF1292 domain-containing protein n=1 Tax=Clostridium botulinum TaxID=1491 RepID=UPI0005F8FBAE|nr:DUF1292 domain-containing protein [Clostridium botulinum]
MNKIMEFTTKEKEKYSKQYTDILFNIDNLKDLLEEDKLKLRKFYPSSKILKEYLDLIDEANLKADGKGLFEYFKDDSKYKEELEKFKQKHIKNFIQIEECLKCSCFNCVKDCKLNSCLGCKEGSCISNCDHDTFNITIFKDRIIKLTNDATGEDTNFEILAIIQLLENNKKYILLENVLDSEDKYILYYFTTIHGEEFEQIEDGGEVDKIAEIFYSQKSN